MGSACPGAFDHPSVTSCLESRSAEPRGCQAEAEKGRAPRRSVGETCISEAGSNRLESGGGGRQVGSQERGPSVLPTGRPRSRRWPGPGGRPPLPSPSAPRPQSSTAPGRRRRRARSRYCVIGGADGRRDPPCLPGRRPGGPPARPEGPSATCRQTRRRLPMPGMGTGSHGPPLLPTSSVHSLAGRVLPPPRARLHPAPAPVTLSCP